MQSAKSPNTYHFLSSALSEQKFFNQSCIFINYCFFSIHKADLLKADPCSIGDQLQLKILKIHLYIFDSRYSDLKGQKTLCITLRCHCWDMQNLVKHYLPLPLGKV